MAGTLPPLRKGNPLYTYFLRPGISRVGSNPESAANILDGGDRLRPDLGVLTVDLGATFWFHALRISLDESPLGFLWGYIVRASAGERDFSGRMHWRRLSRPEREDISPYQYWHVQDLYEPPQKVRWLEIAPQSEDPRQSRCSLITEYQLFASGYPAEVVLTSDLIELPAVRQFGAITREARTPPGTRLDIRTRSGNVRDKVIRYFDKYGAELTPASWSSLLGSMRGPTDMTRVPGSGWSSWSPPYRSSGERVLSPGLRPFVQLQVEMGSEDRHVAAALRAIGIELLTPVVGPILAEIRPSRISAPGRTDTFEVFVQPHFIEQPVASRSRGFDELRLVLPAVGRMELIELGLATGTADGEQLFQPSSTPGVFIDAEGNPLQILDTGGEPASTGWRSSRTSGRSPSPRSNWMEQKWTRASSQPRSATTGSCCLFPGWPAGRTAPSCWR